MYYRTEIISRSTWIDCRQQTDGTYIEKQEQWEAREERITYQRVSRWWVQIRQNTRPMAEELVLTSTQEQRWWLPQKRTTKRNLASNFWGKERVEILLTIRTDHAIVFPPHCNASTRHVTASTTNVAQTKSSIVACRRISRGEYQVGLAPKGGDDSSKWIVAVMKTLLIRRLMKKHQRYWSSREVRTGSIFILTWVKPFT